MRGKDEVSTGPQYTPNFLEYPCFSLQTGHKLNSIVREECTEKAINNAITGYILNDEIPKESVAAIVSCLRSKLVEISVIDESAIQTNFTITVQAFILEESIIECI